MVAKESKNQVSYTPHAAKHEERCALCVYFLSAQSQCRRVAGAISKAGWCELFATGEGNMTSIGEPYRMRKNYSPESSKKDREKERGGAKSDPVNDLRASHRREDSVEGAKNREETIALNNKLAARQAREPHISYADDDARQRRAMDAKHRDHDGVRAKRHRAELDAAMARHMPS